MAQTMIEKYGRVRVRRIVADFYDKVLRSSRLAHYFDGVDIAGLVAHQSAFLAAVMGGPSAHSTEEISAIHSGLGVSSADFQSMVDMLDSSMEKFEVHQTDREQVIDRYLSMETAVVGGNGAGV